ncbi:MAG: ribosome hibernation-promoting factor, HPF/YfiA family, partial [Bryobacteraceae bacterium]
TLPPKIQAKLDAKFAKLAKLLDGRGEREAHVIVTQERHLYRAEVTLQFYDHQLVSVGSDTDLFTALSETLDKLDKQAIKQRSKWREKSRHKEAPRKSAKERAEPAPAETGGAPAKRVFRVNHTVGRKPITLDEAVMEMEKDRDYLVYRDTEREGLSVLVRRRDGTST